MWWNPMKTYAGYFRKGSGKASNAGNKIQAKYRQQKSSSGGGTALLLQGGAVLKFKAMSIKHSVVEDSLWSTVQSVFSVVFHSQWPS